MPGDPVVTAREHPCPCQEHRTMPSLPAGLCSPAGAQVTVALLGARGPAQLLEASRENRSTGASQSSPASPQWQWWYQWPRGSGQWKAELPQPAGSHVSATFHHAGMPERREECLLSLVGCEHGSQALSQGPTNCSNLLISLALPDHSGFSFLSLLL